MTTSFIQRRLWDRPKRGFTTSPPWVFLASANPKPLLMATPRANCFGSIRTFGTALPPWPLVVCPSLPMAVIQVGTTNQTGGGQQIAVVQQNDPEMKALLQHLITNGVNTPPINALEVFDKKTAMTKRFVQPIIKLLFLLSFIAATACSNFEIKESEMANNIYIRYTGRSCSAYRQQHCNKYNGYPRQCNRIGRASKN